MIQIVLAQIAVSTDVTRNLRRIITALESTNPGDWIIFPEGMIGGYTPDRPPDLRRIDRRRLAAVVEAVTAQTQAQRCHTVIGRLEDGKNVDTNRGAAWRNTTAYMAPDGAGATYVKANLAPAEREHVPAGDALPVFVVNGVTFGIQMGRDLLFPEQWKTLRKRGSSVIFHTSNATRTDQGVWRNLLIARAVENGCYVVSANNAEPPQAAPSMVIAPDGRVVVEIAPQTEGIERVEIDLSAVNDDLIRQERRDLVGLDIQG